MRTFTLSISSLALLSACGGGGSGSSGNITPENRAPIVSAGVDIDLWVGGLAEDPLTSEGSQLGELFREIMIVQ